MNHGDVQEHPTHGLAHVNAVMATLALLTGTCTTGVVHANVLYQVDATPARIALLEAVTAIQTEVSLSIFASDPLIAEASHGMEFVVESDAAHRTREELVDATDRVVQDWLSLLAGRGQQITEIGDLILSRGEVSIEEIADRLGISVAVD